MTTTEQQQNSEYRIYEVRDSNGDFHTIQRPICHICKNPIYSQAPHNSCLKEVAVENAAERERIRRDESLKVFGEILNENEYYIRMYPNDSYQGQETFNKRLARLERERKEAERQERFERQERKRTLPVMEQRYFALKAQVEREDAEEEAARKQEQQSE